MLTVLETIKAIEATRPRSKWQQGVKQTALDHHPKHGRNHVLHG